VFLVHHLLLRLLERHVNFKLSRLIGLRQK